MGMDIYGLNPSAEAGKYFRANVWSWRPIHQFIEDVKGVDKETLRSMGFNDGAGLKTQDECTKLADAMQTRAAKMREDGIEEISVDFCNGLAVDKTGLFVDYGTPGSRSPYYTDLKHVEKFILFLRSCGGFEVC